MKFRLKRVTDRSPQASADLISNQPQTAPVPDLDREGGTGRAEVGASRLEARVVGPKQDELIAWARTLARQERTLVEPAHFYEKPLVPVWVDKVSSYAARHLSTIAFARLYQLTGCWGRWTPEWWQDREKEAMGALQALSKSLYRRGQNQRCQYVPTLCFKMSSSRLEP